MIPQQTCSVFNEKRIELPPKLHNLGVGKYHTIPQQIRPNIRQLPNIKTFSVLKSLEIVESINLQKIDNSTYLEKPFHKQE